MKKPARRLVFILRPGEQGEVQFNRSPALLATVAITNKEGSACNANVNDTVLRALGECETYCRIISQWARIVTFS